MVSRPRIWSPTFWKRVGTRTSFAEENSLFQRKYSLSSTRVTLSKTGSSKAVFSEASWDFILALRDNTMEMPLNQSSSPAPLYSDVFLVLRGGKKSSFNATFFELVCGIEQILWVFTKCLKIAYILHSVRCALRCCIVSVFMFNMIIFHSARLQVVSTLYNLLNPVNKRLLTRHTEDTHHPLEFHWVKTLEQPFGGTAWFKILHLIVAAIFSDPSDGNTSVWTVKRV